MGEPGSATPSTELQGILLKFASFAERLQSRSRQASSDNMSECIGRRKAQPSDFLALNLKMSYFWVTAF